MKQKLSVREAVLMISGFFFAGYSAYNVFLIFRDMDNMSTGNIFITAAVAFLFGVLALFTWSFGLSLMLLRDIRKGAFIIAMALLFAMKLRMAGTVVDYLDFTQLHTILYAAAYWLTQVGLLLLIVHYIFIRKDRIFFPRASKILPAVAAAMFLCSLALEAVLFFVYGIGLEASPRRTMVIRPVFYLGFICLSLYYLIPPQKPKDTVNQNAPQKPNEAPTITAVEKTE